MFAKLIVRLKITVPKFVRRKSAMSQLEKFEKLRSLCCMSELEKKRLEAQAIIGPAKKETEYSAYEPCCPPEDKEPVEWMCMAQKTAMVVGGASGIGFETCRALLKAGVSRICIVDKQQDKALAAVDKLNSCLAEPKACPIIADIRSDCAFNLAFREAIRAFCQVDIYINCVGVFNETPECWDQMIQLNLIGAIRGTILAYHYISQNPQDSNGQRGAILNVSSYGSIANIPSMPLYSAASNGINGLTASFGQDFHFCNSGIRCIALCPSCTSSGLAKKMSSHHYRCEWAAHSTTTMMCKQKQSPKDVAKAIVHTLKYGLNGNIYVIAAGKYYRYNMPDYKKIIRREAYML